MPRILIVEDERHLADGLRFNLEAESHIAEVVDTGEAALARLGEEPAFDAVVLDVMLPGIDGFAVATELRKRGQFVPVLMLTARGAPQDVLRGFAAGADDYLPKPFAFQELLARLRALGRRKVQAREATQIHVDGLTLDLRRRRADREGRAIELSPKEFSLLELLMRNQGRVLTRTQILDHIWGYDYAADSNLVDVYVAYLRRKVDRGGGRRLIRTVRGVGYALGD
jgi:two-component system, OmpR family, response regulator